MRIVLSPNQPKFLKKINSEDLKDKDILAQMLFIYVLNNGKYSSYYYSSGTKSETDMGVLIREKKFVNVVGKELLSENLEYLPENIIECIVSENKDIFVETLKQLLK